VTEAELIVKATAYLLQRGFEDDDLARQTAHEFVDFCCGRAWVFSEAGLTADGEKLFAFTHRTFLEYFAAHQLAASHDTPEQLARQLAPRIARKEWDVVAELAIQIKDRGAERGAERIVTKLLDSRQSETNRSNIRTFVAQLLESIDLPATLIRRLTREVIDCALLESKARSTAPLSNLVWNCWSSRDVVRDTVEARVAEMIAANDAKVRRDGLRVAVSCGEASSTFATQMEVRDYWNEFSTRQVEKYSDQILEAAEQDKRFRHLAHDRELITTGELLERWPDNLGGLLDDVHATLLPHIRNPKMLWAVWLVLTETEYDSTAAKPLCVSVSRFLADSQPKLPWVIDYSGSFRLSLAEKEFVKDLDAEVFTGLTIALLVFIEAEFRTTPPDFLARDWGALESVRPYVLARFDESHNHLTQLPVASHIQRAIDDWASNRLNFISIERS